MPLLLQCKQMPEEWRPVVGYEGLYEVSSLGQVRSVDRIVIYPNGKSNRNFKGKLLKQCLNVRNRYHGVRLSKQGKTKLWLTHQLVANAFLGLPLEQHVICHGPKGQFCNEVTNLSWGTMKQNIGPDRVRDGTDSRGEKSSSAKLNKMQVKVIRRLLESKTMTQKEIADIFGVRPGTICDIKKGRTWQHL
jgi:predicted XRE-type DNA-binding protein